MKRMILTVAFVMSLAGGKLFAAGDERVSRQAKETFKKEFPTAEFVKWQEIENSGIYLARFLYDNQGFAAYFNEQGSLIATARQVTKENLPYKVSQVIGKKYSDGEILTIEELTMDGTLSYFFTLEYEKTRTVLRVYHDGSVQKIKDERIKIIDKK